MKFRTIIAAVAAPLAIGGAIAGAVIPASSAAASTVSLASYKAPAPDQLKLVYDGTTYTYDVSLHEQFVAPGVELISGTLRDTYEPAAISLPVHGIQFGDDAVLSVKYPTSGIDAGDQGVRTFSGTVGLFGHVTGHWSETGTENGSGPFTLDRI
jgi:hypothetical protein